MKVGIITDAGNMGLEELISTWALQKIIKDLGAQPIIINHKLESKPASCFEQNSKGEGKTGIGSRFKGLFAKQETNNDKEVVQNRIPDLITSRFVILEGNQGLDEGVGVYQHLERYVIDQGKIYDDLKDRLDVYPGAFFVPNSGVLLNQKSYRELAVTPVVKEKYMLVDFSNMDNKKKDFAENLAKEKGISIICKGKEPKLARTIATYQEDEIEKFIGYVWQSELVITDNLAGTIMAFLHEKDFVTIHSGSDEIRSLLQKVKLENHLIGDVSAYQGASSLVLHNKPAFRKAISEYREQLKEFLSDKLELEDSSLSVQCPTNILKSECCGCSACKEVCPKDAIAMQPDKEGFLYPIVDNEKCINCNLCAKVCVKKENSQTIAYEENYPKILAAMNKNEEVRLKSSSGGIFPELVKYTIQEKHGYVVGVKFDENMNAVSDIADNLEDCKAFYGAKYVKSDFSGVFKRIKELLNKGEFVLYSGLPCEAAALKAFLRKPYENLLICEILCHASPSPKVFRKYVEYLSKKFNDEVTNFNFRDKEVGWLAENNNLVVEFANREPLRVYARRNNYYRCFVKDIIARPGCAECSFVYDKRVGDITMGDFWGIQQSDPTMFDNKGTSILMLNTPKGEEVWRNISDKFIHKESNISEAFKYNHKKPIVLKEERHEFFKRVDKEEINKLLEFYNDLR